MRTCRLLIMFVLLAAATSPAGAQVTAPADAARADPSAVRQGAVLFREGCVFCHGVSARGGMRGPDLTTGSWTHGGADAELAATISGGVPGTAMGPNRLTDEEVRQIIAYLRTLQQPATPAIGDARRGETLFFGAQRCASCHIAN